MAEFDPVFKAMSKGERAKMSFIWLGQGLLTTCVAAALFFVGVVIYVMVAGRVEPERNALVAAADFMVSGMIVVSLIFGGAWLMKSLASIKDVAGSMRFMGTLLGLLVVFIIVIEVSGAGRATTASPAETGASDADPSPNA